jgi:hypothetical protein
MAQHDIKYYKPEIYDNDDPETIQEAKAMMVFVN